MNDTNILISTNATNNYEYINQKTTPPPINNAREGAAFLSICFFLTVPLLQCFELAEVSAARPQGKRASLSSAQRATLLCFLYDHL